MDGFSANMVNFYKGDCFSIIESLLAQLLYGNEVDVYNYGAPKGRNNFLVHIQNVYFTNIAIAILDISLLLLIQLSLFQLYDSNFCLS